MTYRPIDRPEYIAAQEVVTKPAHDHSPTYTVWARALSALVALFGVLTFALLSFRLGFKMGEANPNTNLADFIYNASSPLIQPFEGIFRNRTLGGGGIMEPSTVMALCIYAIAALLIVTVLLATSMAARTHHGSTYQRRTRMVHQP